MYILIFKLSISMLIQIFEIENVNNIQNSSDTSFQSSIPLCALDATHAAVCNASSNDMTYSMWWIIHRWHCVVGVGRTIKMSSCTERA